MFDWHYYDPIDSLENDRTWDIALYQDNIPNPFVIDPTLIWRCYFSEQYIPADINIDQLIDVIDVVLIVNQVLDSTVFSQLQSHQADLNQDFSINVLDVLLVVNMILN